MTQRVGKAPVLELGELRQPVTSKSSTATCVSACNNEVGVLSEICFECHALDGNFSTARFPSLAGHRRGALAAWG